MSAIWGKLIFEQNTIEHAVDSIMRKPYEQNCILNKINTKTYENTIYMACGLQMVNDYATKEALPILDSEERFFITADCILDNHDDLAKELALELSTPDGTIIYQAYLTWGLDCIKKFRGVYSIAIYDIPTKTLYLIADHTSGRCLYYYKGENEILFSTLLSPICSLVTDLQYNDNYLYDFCVSPGLMPSITATETPYKNICKISPGCYIKITKDSCREISYWTPEALTFPGYRKASQYGEHFRTLFESCVTDAIKTSGQVGICLSSGLDSASIGAIAATTLNKENKVLKSYTYVPSENGGRKENKEQVLDETKDIHKILEMHPNIQPKFLNNQGKNCLEDLTKGIQIMEIPYKAVVNFPNLMEIYATAKKDGCRIILTGQCGNSTISQGYIDDVLFDMYDKHQYLSFALTLNSYAKQNKESRKKAFKNCIGYFRFSKAELKNPAFRYTPANPFISKALPENYAFEERLSQNHIIHTHKLPLSEPYYKTMVYNPAMYSYLGELDTKMGLAFGLVIRDPSRDMRMLSFCNSIPYKYFAYKGTPRWLIRGNMRDILPTPLLDNWMRYGVQNADWYLRLKRDWSNISPALFAAFSDCLDKLPINEDTIEEYRQKNASSLSDSEQDHTLYLLLLYNLLSFLKEDNKQF